MRLPAAPEPAEAAGADEDGPPPTISFALPSARHSLRSLPSSSLSSADSLSGSDSIPACARTALTSSAVGAALPPVMRSK